MKLVRLRNNLAAAGAALFVASLGVSIFSPMTARAAVNNPTPTAKISFTFDDGLASALTQAAPTLTKYGLSGTNYVITGCVGTKGTCPANKDASYMTWAQITSLQNTYGWEIGSHTVNHPELSTKTPAQQETELSQSKATLAAHGFNATDFASPYGDYNQTTLALIAKYYASHRGFWDQNNNVWPYSDYLINDLQVQEGVTVAQVEAKIDAAIANNQWLVLTMHDIKTIPSSNPDDYEYGTAELDQIAAYVKSKIDAGKLKSVHVNQGLVTSDTNLLPNSSFDNGIADGWTTDAPTAITKDTASNGSYPNATNSVKFVATAANTHLFSPKVAVDSTTTYMLKNFLDVKTLTSGEVAFYIDEYDANGNWISGQYKTAERSAFVENANFTYKPTSANVSKASLQVIVSGGSGITAYLDNAQWFPLQTTAQTNLVANGAFDNGIADGWATDDSTNIKKDTTNHGSPANPQNSISMQATTANKHLFSPQVAVDSTKVYTLTNYLNLQQLTSGEVGFYIDEYDQNGAWISGQYKLGVHTIGAGDVGFQYQPSSVNVKKASLQVIVMANSGTQAYFDNARWYAN